MTSRIHITASPRAALRSLTVFALALLLVIGGSSASRAFEIQRVTSPGGVEAWLVEEHSIPLVAVEFAFQGGAAHDPADRQGLANVLSGMLDEGAGDMDSRAFQTALQRLSVKLSFNARRDAFHGNLQTLSKNLDEAFTLLRLAVNEPRFDDEPLARIKRQITVALRRNMQDPEQVTSRAWMSLAFGDHPYALDPDGTVEGVTAVTVDDLRALHGRLFARDNLKIAVVGDIDAATLAAKLDETFGALPQASTLGEIPEAEVQAGPVRRVIPMDIPQAQIQFGHVGFKRHHPDFIAAYIMNHILGGGGFSSRLTEEVREKRGLSYSVYSYLAPLDHAGLFIGGAATQNRRAAEALEVIQAEIERMAREGPTAEELEAAKTYLTGSYALRFDTSTKIAAQLLGIQLDDLGIDYVEKRNEMIEAVTLDDVRRVAAELLKPDLLLVTVVGQPAGIEDSPAIR